MQTRLRSMLAVVGLALIFLTSCDKDDDPAPPTTKTKTELITQSTWKFEKVAVATVDFTDNPIFSCVKDNTITFSSNLSGSISEGTVVCTPTTAGPFTWEFKTSETILYVSTNLITTGSKDFKIETLTETNLVLSQVVTLPGFPVPVNVVVTLKH